MQAIVFDHLFVNQMAYQNSNETLNAIDEINLSQGVRSSANICRQQYIQLNDALR